MRAFLSFRFALLLPALFPSFLTATAQSGPVKSITITSRWGGLVPPPPPGGSTARPGEFVLRNQSGKYFYSDGVPVPATFVESLVQAIGAAPVEQLKPLDLGITQEWLNDSVEKARRKNEPLSPYASDFWLSSFKAAFTDKP